MGKLEKCFERRAQLSLLKSLPTHVTCGHTRVNCGAHQVMSRCTAQLAVTQASGGVKSARAVEREVVGAGWLLGAVQGGAAGLVKHLNGVEAGHVTGWVTHEESAHRPEGHARGSPG